MCLNASDDAGGSMEAQEVGKQGLMSVRPARVLLVDDEQSILNCMRIFLVTEGYEVDTASNAEQAKAFLDKEAYDVVVTDIMMPGVSGVEVLRMVLSVAPDVPVLLMTGDPSVQTAVDALRAGASDYLLKPITRSDILGTVRNAANLKAMRDQNRMLEQQNRSYRENLEQMVRDRTAALDRTVKSVIQAMSKLVEIRDPYTAGHERNVADLSCAIARKMGLGDSFVQTVYYAGLVHDLGKISVPAEILSYPGKLNEAAMAVIRMHPETAHEILKQVDFPWPLAEVVVQHHERCDGSGYPHGLVRSGMRLESCILAVADVVESMSSHRPYRAGLGIEVALDEVEANSGRLYDAEVVRACVALFREDGYQIGDAGNL